MKSHSPSWSTIKLAQLHHEYSHYHLPTTSLICMHLLVQIVFSFVSEQVIWNLPFGLCQKKMSLHSCRSRPCRQSSICFDCFLFWRMFTQSIETTVHVSMSILSKKMLELRFVLVYSFCGQFQVAPGLDSALLSCHGFCVQITNFPTRHHHH